VPRRCIRPLLLVLRWLKSAHLLRWIWRHPPKQMHFRSPHRSHCSVSGLLALCPVVGAKGIAMFELGTRWHCRLAAIVPFVFLAGMGWSRADVVYTFDGTLPLSGDTTFTCDAPSYIAASASTSCTDSAGGPCEASLIGSSVIISYDESFLGLQLPTMATFTFPNNALLAGGTYSTVPGSYAAGTLTVSGGGGGPPPLPPSLYETVTLPNNGTQIELALSVATSPPPGQSYLVPNTALPPSDATLAQAAQDLGFTTFDISQEVAIPSGPSPYYECSDLSCSSTINIANQTVPDAPQYGWSYCNPSSKSYDNRFPACLNYPFALPIVSPIGSATYTDNPTDDCLFGGTGKDCGGETQVTKDPLVFLTTLDGVTVEPDGTAVATPLWNIGWSDDYNGTSGGI